MVIGSIDNARYGGMIVKYLHVIKEFTCYDAEIIVYVVYDKYSVDECYNHILARKYNNSIPYEILIKYQTRLTDFKKKHKDKLPSNKFTHALAVVATFHAVAFSFLIFSGFLDQLFFK